MSDQLELDIKHNWRLDLDEAKKVVHPHDVVLLCKKGGNLYQIVAHWAYGGGEDQPAFGPAWFRWNGSGYSEIPVNDESIVAWQPVHYVPRAMCSPKKMEDKKPCECDWCKRGHSLLCLEDVE